jgi:predicted ATPase
MALHTGTAEAREGEFKSGEYVSGITLSRVSRLLSAGHGGQVLLSLTTVEFVRGRLPSEVSLLDLGLHLLRDLAQPQRIFQLAAPGLRSDFPALKALHAPPHNLPIPLNSFVGREVELAAIRDQLRLTRLLTLSGPGGSGKTRLSIHAASSVFGEFADGAWFVELAPVADPTFLASAVAYTFGLREQGSRKPEDVLMDFLNDKQVLLVIDNCEHMVEAVARLAQRLLACCPAIKILATTREALGIPGELVFPVRPLTMPEAGIGMLGGAEELMQYESVRLFLDRAVAAQPSFVVDRENASAVTEICIRLDGIPLAIELAAARTKMLSAQQVQARLNDRFRLLTGGSRTAMPRQQTLRAAIDWSFDLLSASERAVLRRLSVFAGGCTLDAAEAVASGAEIDIADVLELLGQLVNKSLVGRREGDETARYQVLESVRQYAAEKLVEAGEHAAVRDRHLEHFLRLVEAAEPLLYGRDQLAALMNIGAESDNIRAAMEWAASAPRTLPGLRLASRMGRYWTICSEYVEGVFWLRRMMAAPNALSYPVEYAWALYFVGFMAWFQGDRSTMQQALQQSFEMAQACGDRRCEAYTLDFLGVFSVAERDFALAAQRFSEAQGILRQIDDHWGVALTLWHMGISLNQQNDDEGALRPWEQALALYRSVGDSFRTGVLLRVIGLIRVRTGDASGGLDLLRQSLRIAVERRAKFEIANALWAFGEAAEQDDQAPAARPLIFAAFGIYDSLGSLRSTGNNMLEVDRAKLWFDRHKEQVEAAFAEKRIPDIDEAIELAMAFRPKLTQTAAPA